MPADRERVLFINTESITGSLRRIAQADVVILVKPDGSGRILKDREAVTNDYIPRSVVNLLKRLAREVPPPCST